MFPATSSHSAICMSTWLESYSVIRKIDNYMMNHPLWSPYKEMRNNRKWKLNPQAREYVPRASASASTSTSDSRNSIRVVDPRDIQIQVSQRNEGADPNFMIVSWISNHGIAEWFMKENLVPNKDEAQRIEDMCKELIHDTITTHEYVKIKKGGVDVIEKLSVEQRKFIEQLYEIYFRNALEGYFSRRGRSYDKEVVMTPAFVEEIMTEYLQSTSDANYEDVIAYAKYRHTEFRHEFIVGCNSVRFTVFAYVLPENKCFHECIYHKSSIIVKNSNFTSGKYQTCRWNL